MTTEDPLVGQILLGKLEVIRRLGGGGMGVVYEVEHRLTGHRRALKVVHAKYADRPRFMKRLLREAKVAGTLATPYVVETYDAGRLEDGSAYVLMELLHGQTLYDLMQTEGKIAPKRLANIMAQVAEGVAVAHEAGIVHRDVKPENIFLIAGDDDEERVKILDFGVSKFDLGAEEAPTRLTAEGTLVGTPYYMSPEQASGKKVDARTDVYAMGVILYESLTGRLPFEAESVGELFVKIGAGECVPLRMRRPDLDDDWCEIVHRAFHRDPDVRYPTSEALRRDLVPLGSGGTKKRARTISDSGRSTIGYGETRDEAPRASDRPVDPDASSEVHALSAPPPPPEERSDGGMPGWGWAALGAAAVLALVLPWQLTREPTPPEPTVDAPPSDALASEGEAEGEAEGAAEAEAEPSVARAETEPDAGVGEERESPTRPSPEARPGGGNRARAAGLDPNPYR